LNSIDADMKSEIGSSRGVLRPYPLRFHVEEAGADAKLNQHGPLGVAYHRRHPIFTVPVARITAHATVPGLNTFLTFRDLCLRHMLFYKTNFQNTFFGQAFILSSVTKLNFKD
jgi:hypothetical protein